MEQVLRLSSTCSTNDVACKLAARGHAHGYGVIAEQQTAGRGRLGKDWVSPSFTGLYCSIILRPDLPFSNFPQVTLTAGLALCIAVENLLPAIPFGLKWPNDLHCHGKKCGGILVESSAVNCPANELFVVVGIGLNVNTLLNEFPADLQQQATSLRLVSGKTFSIRETYRKIHTTLLDYVHIHESRGFKAILNEWRKRDVLYGKEMVWVTSDKKLVTARGLGPDEHGRLLAEDQSGKVYEILSGDVRLAG